jgi:hypothetical protein
MQGTTHELEFKRLGMWWVLAQTTHVHEGTQAPAPGGLVPEAAQGEQAQVVSGVRGAQVHSGGLDLQLHVLGEGLPTTASQPSYAPEPCGGSYESNDAS